MKLLIPLAISVITLLLVSTSYASDTCPESSWPETGKVERVDVGQNEILSIKFDWSDNAVAICNLSGSTTGPNPASSSVCKGWMAQAITAHVTGGNLIIKHTQPNCFRGWGGLTDDVISVYIE